jgi:uncharacterized protein YjiK
MSTTRGLVLLLCSLSCLAACRDTPEVKAAQVRKVEAVRKQALEKRIAAVDAGPDKSVPIAQWLMPPQLREISGLALTSSGTVLTHDDNVGRVYEIDPKTGILLRGFSLKGNVKGDFEAITTVGSDIYLMSSNGRIYVFKAGKDGSQVDYRVYNTGLGKQCEFESLAYEPDSSRLLMACKRFLDKNEPHALLIFRIPLPLSNKGAKAGISTMRIPIEEVAGSNKWKNFRPSDMNIDPSTGNYVLVASREKALVVITPEGDVVRSEPLPGDHRQAEGVAITRDSILLVSDEANVKPAAITLYRWRP